MTTTPFDAASFADELRAAMERAGLGPRELGKRLTLSPATVSRAAGLGGWPQLSHMAYLQLRAWLDMEASRRAAA